MPFDAQSLHPVSLKGLFKGISRASLPPPDEGKGRLCAKMAYSPSNQLLALAAAFHYFPTLDVGKFPPHKNAILILDASCATLPVVMGLDLEPKCQVESLQWAADSPPSQSVKASRSLACGLEVRGSNLSAGKNGAGLRFRYSLGYLLRWGKG